MPIDAITTYLDGVRDQLATGRATEHSYRPALKALIESLSGEITATNEPRRVKCGAPDLIITRGQTPLGYVEAKDIGRDLDEVERSEQLRRYLDSLGNLVLTNYIEFRWYLNGEQRLSARIARLGKTGKLERDSEGAGCVLSLLETFLSARVPSVGDSRELAARMAAATRLLREAIVEAFRDEDGGGSLHAQLMGFKKVLLHDLEPDRFADTYAQTVAYGLFAARCNHRGANAFSRIKASFEIPRTNPFLRKMFGYIAGPDLDERLTWAVDHLAELLSRADMRAILADFGRRVRGEDPVVHFYETFLAAYDPKMREARGVYYTPEPVVNYIVRSVDHILKADFGLPDGLADTTKIKIGDGRECHKVLILDPACGTGTFLHGVIDHIHEHIVSKGQAGLWPGYVSEHLLPRLFGFELLMAPYAVAHLKLGLQLQETGYDFKSGERLRIYMTNTLEAATRPAQPELFAGLIAEEANAASEIKSDKPVMVILGNPPYSYESQNLGKWIGALVRDYYECDGEPLGERNPKGLQDDYVKFIRFAQWKIEKTGHGVLAFISNHGYLDNPTFRGMRRSLMKTFDAVYIVDLHGNVKKKESAPDGSKDENVFDIQQGVAIGIFVRSPGRMGQQEASVKHRHLWGVRVVRKVGESGEERVVGGKHLWLTQKDVKSTDWTELRPRSPHYFFIPRDVELSSEYGKGFGLSELMPLNAPGIVASRDRLVVHFNEDDAWKAVKSMSQLHTEAARDAYRLGKDTKEWQTALALKDLNNTGPMRERVTQLGYRPFDIRYTYYTGVTRGFMSRPRRDIMRHLLRENMGLVFMRQVSLDEAYSHFLVTRGLIDNRIFVSSRGYARVAPLYVYPLSDGNHVLPLKENNGPGGRRPNLSPEFIRDFSQRLSMAFVADGRGDRHQTFGPEDIFDYMYAVFYSPAYRSRYAEFLKIDFPRLPLTSSQDLFRELCGLGNNLVGLHTLAELAPIQTSYPVAGDNRVDTVRYTEPGQGAEVGRVWINNTQFFKNVPPEVWHSQIGGYQVCHKWLKDRKGRLLTYDELTHYQHIVSALARTIELMAEIDLAIDAHGGWPID